MSLSGLGVEQHQPLQDMMEVGALQGAPAPIPILEIAGSRNLRVHPVKVDKTPFLTGWPDVASSSPEVIERWAERFPACNWGVALDADTLVIDCDSQAALSAFGDLGEAHGGIPATLTTITGRGVHFWFRKPKTLMVRNRAVMPGVDAKTKGGFVVIPPSVHRSGTRYKFVWDEAPIADAPAWVLDLVTAKLATATLPGTTASAPENDAQSAQAPASDWNSLTPFERDISSRAWEKRVAPGKVPDGRSPFALRIALEPQNVTNGMRNAALFAYLCRLRRSGKPEEFIRSEAFRVVARIPEPLSKFEIERIIANAMKYDANPLGENTLVEAWRTVEQIEAGPGATKFYRFLLLVEQLAQMRPETRPTILLPVHPIGTLMNVHYTQVSKWRRKAMEAGILSNTSRYVRHRLADEFAVKAGFSPLADGISPYKVKRGRKPKKSVEQEQPQMTHK